MKRLLLLFFAVLWSGAAFAQVSVVPQVGLITSVLKQNTYSAISHGLVPASAATDILCISSGTSKNVSIKRVEISGVAGTAINVPFAILRRITLDTGGTPATGAALPIGAANFSTDPASTAVLTAYTGNPTITDASPTYYRTGYVGLPLAASGGASIVSMLFGEEVGWFTKGLDILKGSTQQYCLNLNATTVSSGLLEINMSWTEN